MKVLITGAGGLIGSECVRHFSKNKNNKIYGIDNNSRKTFFGSEGDVSGNINKILKISNYIHSNQDIRNNEFLESLFKTTKFDAIIHTAANPSHDFPVKQEGNILLDYEINSTATLYLLENFRKYCPEATFIFLSTNKVSGDNVNKLDFIEKETRYDYASPEYFNGISETNLSVDQCKHSLFGCSKASADFYVYEYGSYFDLKSYCLRGGCLTGAGHAGTEAHGFLNYIIKSHIKKIPYTILGYSGKMVRDNIHSNDVASLINCIIENPQKGGVVFNIGGGRENSISHLEAARKLEEKTGEKFVYQYQDKPREGDHLVWISDMAKFKNIYKNWSKQYSLDDIFDEIILSIK